MKSKTAAFHFAQTEIEILAKCNPDSKLLQVKGQILDLCQAFGNSGQSGGSAPYTARSIVNEVERSMKQGIINETIDHDSLHFDFRLEIGRLCQGLAESGMDDLPDFLLAVEKLLLFEPLMPITGLEEEWGEVRDVGSGQIPWYQNRRCSALFKDGGDGKPYYIDAIVKRDQRGVCWSGYAWLSEEDYKTGDRSKMVGKKGYVKSFPFTPKTFYIDVNDVEVAKDDWESFVKNPDQLEEVWDYYDRH